MLRFSTAGVGIVSHATGSEDAHISPHACRTYTGCTRNIGSRSSDQVHPRMKIILDFRPICMSVSSYLAAIVRSALLLVMNLIASSTEADPADPSDLASGSDEPHQELRVCADPNNLPFSNDQGEGFENQLAELVARELGLRLRYTWWAQRRGFTRNTLQAGRCDVIVGVPTAFEMAQTTKPYYRSTYVFVTRSEDRLDLRSLDDPQLRKLRIGLHSIGDDYSNVPPAHALASRGLVSNVRAYSIYGDYSKPNPPRDLLAALSAGEIDVAIAWGPLAGYFASREPVALQVSAIAAQSEVLPMQFDISMAVRRDDDALARRLDAILTQRANEIKAILVRYGVPILNTDVALAR